VGWEKVVCWSTKAAISLKRVKIQEKLLWSIEGLLEVTNAFLNGTICDPLTTSSSLDNRVHNPQPKL